MFRRLFDPTPAARYRLVAVGVVLLAAVLRLWALDARPPHFDEGVNGMFTDRMQQTGFYAYDPTNYHGPLHFYVLFLFKSLFGRNLWALRLPTALVSILAVAWTFRFSRFFDRRLCVVAALGLAWSPASVYFGRDAIHESWLAFFLLLSLEGVLGLWRDGETRDLWALGLGLAGMVLTKETYVVHVGCFGLAALVLWTWERTVRTTPASVPIPPRVPPRWRWVDLAAVAAAGGGAIVFFYSGGFFNPAGLKGIYETFTPWLEKSQAGEGHRKWPLYWLELLVAHEPWALVGLIAGMVLMFVRTDWRLRLLAIYGTGTLLAYSLIPYKTPWCMVSIVWPFFFLAAAGWVALAGRWRVLGAGTLLAVGAFAVWRTATLNFQHPADAPEERVRFWTPFGPRRWNVPQYVYVQTLNQVTQLTLPLLELAHEDPVHYQMRGLVLADSYHPLPWMLGDFPRVGYYDRARTPEDFHADFLVVAEEREAEVEAGLAEPYYKEKILLRPALGPLVIYLRAAPFQHLMPEREPEFDPAAGGENEGGETPAATPAPPAP